MNNPFLSTRRQPLTSATPIVGIGTGASVQTVQLTEIQYHALRRVVGLRFCSQQIGDEYAELAARIGKTESQVVTADWNTLANAFELGTTN